MSLVEKYKSQLPTKIGGDLRAHLDARVIGKPDTEAEEAEVPVSPSDDDAQEDNERDDFDGEVDWRDTPEEKECDVTTFNIIEDFMTIYDSADRKQGDESLGCTANFTLRNFSAQFTYVYRLQI